MSFDNGTRITVEPDAKFEAWNLTGDDFGIYAATSA
jgi:hypothetical protein